MVAVRCGEKISWADLRLPICSRSFILVLLLIYFPLALVFEGGGNYDEPPIIGIRSILNFSAIILVLAFADFSVLRKRQSRLLMELIALLLATYGVNYVVTSYASWKWLINTLGFVFVFYSIASLLVNSKDKILLRASAFMNLTISIIMPLFILMAGALLISDSTRIFETFRLGDHNSNIYLLTESFNVEKQALGILLSLVVIWNIAFWHSVTHIQRFIFFVLLLIFSPFWIGIRTFILTLILLSGYWLIATRAWIMVVSVFTLPLVALILALEWGFIMEVLSKYNDRLPSLLYALDVLKNTPFGLGNGGYHIVVDAFNLDILAQFGASGMTSFWLAPESDLVYFIASFGVLSLVFFGFYAFLLIKGVGVLRSITSHPFEKFLLLGCISFIFSGISQDNAGGLIWWLYMAAGFAVILKRNRLTLRVRSLHRSRGYSSC
jgi:hypothetical protein